MGMKPGLAARLVLMGTLGSALALPAAGQVAEDGEIDLRDQKVLSSRTFLNAHPDLKYRNEGWVAYEEGDHAAATAHFRKAASYADKPSQAMLAEMLWQGRGVPADRALAYAWADLAAERGYPQFLRLREQYWRQLDEGQRARALSEGRALLPEFADAVARPRLAAFMKRARQLAKRSAPYASQPREVWVPGPFGGEKIPAHRFYAKKYWDPVQYQTWQDRIWTNPPDGQVDVGDVEQVAPGEN